MSLHRALAIAVLTASTAHAGEPAPEPAVVDAGDANLESIQPRRDFLLTAGFGPSFSIGFSLDDATAQGGALTLRLAHVANRRALFAVEAVVSALFFGVSGHTYRTEASNLLVAVQYYVNPALWLRAGVGWGRYMGRELRVDDFILRDRFVYDGPSGSAGVGLDVLRIGRFRGGLELSSTTMINRDGALSTNALLIALSID